mgnify:FL=1
MAHIDLPEGLPGIIGPMAFRPETSVHLNRLADALLRDETGITRGERELIASYVSHLNECNFCCKSHSAFAAHQLDDGYELVDAVLADIATAPVSDKVRALLVIAGQVQQSGRKVTADHVAAARDAGATDLEIHDAVLIAAAFCMYNRYVDGLGTFAPPDRADYDGMAQDIVANGYAATAPAV